jgi:hypothetical protein
MRYITGELYRPTQDNMGEQSESHVGTLPHLRIAWGLVNSTRYRSNTAVDRETSEAALSMFSSTRDPLIQKGDRIKIPGDNGQLRIYQVTSDRNWQQQNRFTGTNTGRYLIHVKVVV